MPEIKEMYAFVTEDSGPDDEGIVGMKLGQFWYPMVGADMARVQSLRPTAQALSRLLNKPIKVLRFTNRELIETIKPDGNIPPTTNLS